MYVFALFCQQHWKQQWLCHQSTASTFLMGVIICMFRDHSLLKPMGCHLVARLARLSLDGWMSGRCDHAGSEAESISLTANARDTPFFFLPVLSLAICCSYSWSDTAPTLRNRKHLSQCEMWPYRIRAEVERVVEEFGGVKKRLREKKTPLKRGINHSEMTRFADADCWWVLETHTLPG